MQADDKNSHLRLTEVFRRRIRFIRFACYYVRDETVAEDLVMDSIVYYWENRHKVDAEQDIAPYILTVLKHKCIDWLRRQQTMAIAYERVQSDAEWDLSMKIATLEAFEPYEIFTADFRDRLMDAMDALPAKTRRIFELSRFDELSYADIAASESVSVKTVEYHISKALKVLRSRLGNINAFIFLFL